MRKRLKEGEKGEDSGRRELGAEEVAEGQCQTGSGRGAAAASLQWGPLPRDAFQGQPSRQQVVS